MICLILLKKISFFRRVYRKLFNNREYVAKESSNNKKIKKGIQSSIIELPQSKSSSIEIKSQRIEYPSHQ
jgi:hypothetical protein